MPKFHPFNGQRKGFRVSRHLERKSTEELRSMYRRLCYSSKPLTTGEMGMVHVLIGVLKDRNAFEGMLP